MRTSNIKGHAHLENTHSHAHTQVMHRISRQRKNYNVSMLVNGFKSRDAADDKPYVINLNIK